MMKVQLTQCKLGYGGTKEEMQRLLKDAGKLTGMKYDISSYADIIDAIHAIQVNMDITGTTAEEADETITGSARAMKSSWSNMMNALVLGGDDFDRCLENLVTTTKTFMKNLIPAVVSSLGGIGDLITELAPILEEEVPVLVETLLPPLIKAATALISGLIKALPTIVKTLAAEIPGVLSEVWTAIEEVLGDDVPIIKKIGDLFGDIGKFCSENMESIEKFIPALGGLFLAFKALKKFGGFSSITSLFGKKGKGGGASGGGFDYKSVAKTMGGIAVAIGGVGLVIAAFGALAQIDGYTEFMAGGGAALTQLCGIITDIGLVGAAFIGFVALAGKVTSIRKAANGIGSIAVALGGMEAIVLAFGALASIEGYTDFVTGGGDALKQLCGIIEDCGVMAGAMTTFAGLIGLVPISVVLTGVGNIAAVLGGMEAVVLAFGALAQIKGIKKFMSQGGELMVELCNILGEMAGAIIGGFAEGVTASLPTIGTNVTDFATNISGALTTFNSVDSQGLKDFAEAFGAFVLVLTGEKLLSFITGETDYGALGTQLSTFGTNVSSFFTTVSDIDDKAFTKATSLFNCLAGVAGLPTEGGIKSWFTGDIAYDSLADGLKKLMSADVVNALKAVSALPATAFTNLTTYLNALTGVNGLPAEGGFFQLFTGAINYESVASGIKTLTSPEMMLALLKLKDIPESAFTALQGLFNALAGITSLPAEGGIFDWFTGKESETLTNIASKLPGVATDIATFHTNLGDIKDFSKISSLFEELGKITISDDATKGTGFLGLGDSKLATVGTTLSEFSTNAAQFFTDINGLSTSNLSTFVTEISSLGGLPTVLTNVNASAGTTLTTLCTTFSDKLGTIATTISALSTTAYNSGVAIAQGISDGITAQLPTLLATVTAMAASVQSAFDVELDINSPSGTMMDSGEDIGWGGILGLRKMIPAAQTAATDFAMAATPFSSYTPEGSATTYNNSSSSEVTNVSPVFNLNISGSTDDRSLARKVKRYVSEAVSETLESLERKTYVTREA